MLADITVGYMGGQGEQWLLVRNERGEELLRLLGDEVKLTEPGSAGKRAGAVKGFLANVQRAAGGLPLRRMPNWLRPIVGWLMPRVGPRGLEFARPGGDEGAGNRGPPAPRAASENKEHAARPCLEPRPTLWADAGT